MLTASASAKSGGARGERCFKFGGGIRLLVHGIRHCWLNVENLEVIQRIKNLRVEQAVRNPCGEQIGNDHGRNYGNCAISCYWSI